MIKKIKGKRGALIKGALEKIPFEVFNDLKEEIKEITKGAAGIYALYKEKKLYYVGLAANLRGRIRWHLKDRHAGKWDMFSIYIIRRVRYLHDLESLILSISKPKGNKSIPRLPKNHRLNDELRRMSKESFTRAKKLQKALRGQ